MFFICVSPVTQLTRLIDWNLIKLQRTNRMTMTIVFVFFRCQNVQTDGACYYACDVPTGQFDQYRSSRAYRSDYSK